jgi:hypothetical protein
VFKFAAVIKALGEYIAQDTLVVEKFGGMATLHEYYLWISNITRLTEQYARDINNTNANINK